MSHRIITWKRAAVSGGLFLLILLGVSVGFSGCMSFQKTDAEIESHFSERGQSIPDFYEHEDDVGSVFLAQKGEGAGVVFVHGSPGSWGDYVHMLSDVGLTSDFTVTAVDRPGFGRTRPKKAEPSLEAQARRIHDAVIASGTPVPALWVGHSLGGPVAARIAADYPESVSGLVLVAPSMDPELEKRKWFNWLGKVPPIRWGLSYEWRNSNDEIFPHKSELVKLGAKLGDLRTPTIVIQGDKDKLVPPGNADYVKRVFPEGVVELRILEGVNHFIPWSHPHEIKRAIRDLSARE
ncbi:alpha/beta fold hydrolase [Pelagicoccus mobilis]|uniref:Alpha/beta hydrolase n=1 Tax=Pelagicoccus mobilis TaxID=415221 RepID=A0A934S318_9BACT|nr:alpha/beta hydrolase [Pelagicoccus mobilis]MBK1878133.1 alpha/beta hydrolase [Pelagicoccus mobilis]